MLSWPNCEVSESPQVPTVREFDVDTFSRSMPKSLVIVPLAAKTSHSTCRIRKAWH
jgi:hypothetical protein